MTWTVSQWIAEREGGYSVRPTGANLIYGGDSHNHWHVKQVEVHQIESLDGKVLGRLVKQGFCFFDTDPYQTELPGAPAKAHWGGRGCAGSFDTRVRMGLSIGWADKYPWHLLDERIDVTDLPDGTYRIREIADPHNEFEESDETNNETWVDIALKTNADGLRETTVVATGPAPTSATRHRESWCTKAPSMSIRRLRRPCGGPYYGPAPRSPKVLRRSGEAPLVRG